MFRQRVPATAKHKGVPTEKKCYRCKVHKPAGELGFVKKSCGFRPLRSRKSSDFFYG